MQRRAIHSEVKIMEFLGALPSRYRSQLNKSQLSRYRKTVPQNYFGNELGSAANDVIEKFRQINRNNFDRKLVFAYLRLSVTLRNIFSSASHFYKTLSKHKDALTDVIQRTSKFIPVRTYARIIGVAESSIRNWITEVRTRCSNSLINLCRRVHPNQLLSCETEAMKKMLCDSEFCFWPLRSLYYYALNNKLVSMCLSSWYKYARLLNVKRLKPHSLKIYGVSIKATRPNQYWHADVTYFKTADGLLHYIYTVVDNFSKFPLAVKLSTKLCGKIRMETFRLALKTAIEISPVAETINLVVDGGSENFNGQVDEFLSGLENIEIKRIRALRDVAYSNSLAEAFNRIIKTYYLNHNTIENTTELEKRLQFTVNDFSRKRPHGELKGLTPFEAYSGKQPASFTQQLLQARRHRIEMNKKFNCKGCLF